LNQKEAYKKSHIVSDVYDKWEEREGTPWARWRTLPMWVIVAKRQTPCVYCGEHIKCGELRVSDPTVHMDCFMKQLTMSMELYSSIQNELIEQGMEKENE